MKTKVLMSVAGLAACGAADAQVRPELQTANFSGKVHQATRATAITGLTVDGQYVYGQTVELGGSNTSRTQGVIAYDAAQLADTDGDGDDFEPVCADLAPHTFTGPDSRYFFGSNFAWQAYAEDIIPVAGTEGGILQEMVFAGGNWQCDGGFGTTSEVFQMVIESWEGADNFPDLDGGDGEFGGAADGVGFPFSLTDSDGDTLVDEFLGGIILTYADTDTDGDTINDQFLSNGGSGYGIFTAQDLDAVPTPLTSNLDLWDGGKPGTDGRPDGGIRLLWTRGDGGDGLGPLNGGLYPSTRAASMLWGTYSMQNGPGACTFGGNFGGGQSDPTIWGEGDDLCTSGVAGAGDWSSPSPSMLTEAIDEGYDTTFDIADWTGIVPDFAAPGGLGVMVRLNVAGGPPPSYDCCDVNGDGACSPADFGAWVQAFNGMLPRCDANNDGVCSPADFGAWIAAFNASGAGNPSQCQE